MKFRNHLQRSSIITGLALGLALASYAPSAHANVYASNIKINGVLTGSASVAQGSGASISYILNEPASLGLEIQIFSGGTAIRTIVIAGGLSGTSQGLNTVAWDGKDDTTANVPPGNYSVVITAASAGYLDWTQIINNANTKVYWPSGVAVDTSTNSPYYGRVMVANGVTTALNVAPHPVGIVKFNADGSEADEGQSTPPSTFRTDAFLSDSCRQIKYGTDDRIYFFDWVGYGRVWACDMQMTTSQMLIDGDLNATFSSETYGPSGFDVTDPGTTNGLVWMCDAADFPSVGVWAFPLTNNGVADSVNGGINVLGTGPNISLVAGPGMMITESGDIYIGEVRFNASDPTPRAISITNVWPSAVDGSPTNWWNGTESYPITSTRLNWAVGGSDDTFRQEEALAIDSRTSPKYVSVAMKGASGGVRILNAADGTLVTNINQNGTVFYVGTGWDNVGNVYLGNAAHFWEAWSPPGANQAATPAIATVQVTAPATPLHITSIAISGGTVTIHFTGNASDPASAFTLLSSATVSPQSSYTPAAGATITGSAGSYTATVPSSGAIEFYRIKR
jgi:hypothetical protein